jgi:hypothetical protein
MKNTILKIAGLHAVGTALYVALVASFMFYGSRLFPSKKEDIVLIPIAMLLLLVLSASVTGSLVLGRPILWYIDGKKKESVSLLLATFGFLFLITIFALVMMVLWTR